MNCVLLRNSDGSYGQLLAALADNFIDSVAGLKQWDQRLFNDWSHALCHLFELYGRPEEHAQSFLNFEHQYEVATRLIEALVKSALIVNSDSCVSRTLNAVFYLNEKCFSEQTLHEPFAFKPAALSQEGFPELIGGVLGAFCAARTPYEFFERILPVGDTNKYSNTLWPVNLDPGLTGFLLQEFSDRIPKEIMDRYLQDFPELDGKVQTVEGLRTSISQAAEACAVEHGIFVDVDGTLISSSDKTLNTVLIEALQKRQEAGDTVTCFTGADPEGASTRLRELGFPESLLPVQSKSEYRGKLLELVIDDVSPGYQGFGAISHLQPPGTWSKKCLVQDGEQWRFETLKSTEE
jgi:hypothetical protein